MGSLRGQEKVVYNKRHGPGQPHGKRNEAGYQQQEVTLCEVRGGWRRTPSLFLLQATRLRALHGPDCANEQNKGYGLLFMRATGCGMSHGLGGGISPLDPGCELADVAADIGRQRSRMGLYCPETRRKMGSPSIEGKAILCDSRQGQCRA